MKIFINSAFYILGFVSCIYLLSRIFKRNDLMDIFWGLGFLLIAFINLASFANFEPAKLLLFFLILLWSLRLSLHIFIKNQGKPEDFRYANWRKEWGKTEWWRSYLQVYLLQGFFMFVIALPILAFGGQETVINVLQKSPFIWIGSAVAFGGLVFEAVADFQKSSFKKQHTNEIMTTGLWKISRHPNYFGEAVFWWGIAIFSFAAAPVIYGLVSALTITWLLRYVSGVPMLEKAKEGNKEYDDYKKETAVFIPFVKL